MIWQTMNLQLFSIHGGCLEDEVQSEIPNLYDKTVKICNIYVKNAY